MSVPMRWGEPGDLQAQLRPSFPTLAENLASDEALPYVPARVAERALEIVAPMCLPASNDELTFALGWLASVTTGDKLRSPEMMQVSARALVQAMREYPAAAAIEAIREWPKTENGKWWPTENELRAEADLRGWRDMRLHKHLRASMTREATSSPRTEEAGPLLRPFIEDVRATFGEPFVKSWLSPITCQYQGKVIWTHPFGAERLKERIGGLIEKHDVVVCSDEHAREAFRRNTAIYEPAKPQRRRA